MVAETTAAGKPGLVAAVTAVLPPPPGGPTPEQFRRMLAWQALEGGVDTPGAIAVIAMEAAVSDAEMAEVVDRRQRLGLVLWAPPAFASERAQASPRQQRGRRLGGWRLTRQHQQALTALWQNRGRRLRAALPAKWQARIRLAGGGLSAGEATQAQFGDDVMLGGEALEAGVAVGGTRRETECGPSQQLVGRLVTADMPQDDSLRDLRGQLEVLRSEGAEGMRLLRLVAEAAAAATAEARAMAEAAHSSASATAQALSAQNEREAEELVAELDGLQASGGADVALPPAGSPGGGPATPGVEEPRTPQAWAAQQTRGQAGLEVRAGAAPLEGAPSGVQGQHERAVEDMVATFAVWQLRVPTVAGARARAAVAGVAEAGGHSAVGAAGLAAAAGAGGPTRLGVAASAAAVATADMVVVAAADVDAEPGQVAAPAVESAAVAAVELASVAAASAKERTIAAGGANANRAA